MMRITLRCLCIVLGATYALTAGCSGSAGSGASSSTGAAGTSSAAMRAATDLRGLAGAHAGAAGAETMAAGPDAGRSGSGTVSDKLSFATDVYERVIRVSCASCHNDAPSFGGLALFPGGAKTAYANLVGVPAGQAEEYLCHNSGLLRVKPGDPEHSLLYLKLTMPTCGKKMPPSGLGGAVTQEQVSLVRKWIAQGAAP